MELSLEQISTLSQMGIPVWELRRSENELQTFNSDAVSMEDLSASFWVVMPQSELNNDEQRLLAAMLKAINLQFADVAILNQGQLDKLKQAILANKRILVLGMALVDELATNMVCTYTVKQLLADNSLKAKAWQALKSFRAMN